MPSSINNAEQLITALHIAFDYTNDNNRDLLHDPIFSQAEITEELNVSWAKDFLSAYITRNAEMINANMED